MKRGLVSLDLGTTSMRAILFDKEGRALGAAGRPTAPLHYSDGRVEQDPALWRSALPEILAGCAELARSMEVEIVALALTSQRSSVIPVDARGEPLSAAIMWQDQRTESLCRELADSTAFVYGRTGLRIGPVFSAIKMTWFRRNEPSIYAACHKMLGIHDYVLHLLTGRFVTDRSLASRTNLFNLQSGAWDPELIELFGLDGRLLCDLVDPGSVVGGLGPAMAEVTGLAEGIPVISAGGDQQCAALGLGLLSPGHMVANTGTGSYIIGLAAQPVFDPGMRLSCNVSAIAGRYIVEAGVLSSGSLYAWFRDRFYTGGDASAGPELGAGGFDLINEEAAQSPPGANGVILLPHFKGAGSPHWNPSASGIFFGLNLGTKRGDMARAVLEGIAAEMAQSIELIESLTGPARELRVAGGLTNFPLYNRIQADMYRRSVLRSADPEATARGAWISAVVALGLYPDHAAAQSALSGTRAAAGEVTSRFEPEAHTAELYARLRARAATIYAALDSGGAYRITSD
ncbi:MAG TPA: FGGY-family carbohydrate kinase [Rectinemataceae bacterium]|nr:FGGY-family carbohydrate kinase [Rectinemataceae bacterium]